MKNENEEKSRLAYIREMAMQKERILPDMLPCELHDEDEDEGDEPYCLSDFIQDVGRI